MYHKLVVVALDKKSGCLCGWTTIVFAESAFYVRRPGLIHSRSMLWAHLEWKNLLPWRVLHSVWGGCLTESISYEHWLSWACQEYNNRSIIHNTSCFTSCCIFHFLCSNSACVLIQPSVTTCTGRYVVRSLKWTWASSNKGKWCYFEWWGYHPFPFLQHT